jgi:hypothetical protein
MIYAQDLKIQLNVKFIFWLMIEVLIRANIKDTFHGQVLNIKLHFKVQEKCIWISLFLMTNL